MDIGGGYGLLVRLLRDVGIEAFWSDEYCKNIFARGFEYDISLHKPQLATSFEVFEHLVNPKDDIDSMLDICPNLLFTTELLPSDIPQYSGSDAWWYYGFNHGQHISFYTIESLRFIAKERGLHCNSYRGIHLFSEMKISPIRFKLAVRLARFGLFLWVRKHLRSKTVSDNETLYRM